MKAVYTFFWFAVLMFCCVYFFNFYGFTLPDWVTSYVNDFLCMPVVLTLCVKVVHIVQKDRHIKLPLAAVLSLTVFYGLYFEAYLPPINPRYTADFVDVLLYFLGGVLFYLLQYPKRFCAVLGYKPDQPQGCASQR